MNECRRDGRCVGWLLMEVRSGVVSIAVEECGRFTSAGVRAPGFNFRVALPAREINNGQSI